MATVIYHANGQALRAAAENPHFLQTNGSGDYLSLGNPNHSNYDGFCIKRPDGRYKVLANIAPVGPTRELEIAQSATRRTPTETQEFYLSEDGLLMEGKGRFLLTLDCKRLYDESDQERHYTMELKRGTPLTVVNVTYEKRDRAYELHVCIATTMHAERLERWRNVQYLYDERRGTPNTPWVYDALKLDGEGTVAVAVGDTPEEAQRRAVQLALTTIRRIARNNDIALPAHAQLAWRSLASLRTKNGIMAGLPWFFHEWSRDELTACGGMLEARQFDAVIRILDKWYGAMRPDGQLPAIYPDQGLPSCDAPGWLGKRTRDLLVRLAAEDYLHRLGPEKMEDWRDRTARLFDACATRVRDGLLWNEANTTWMDTSRDDDGRAGARIEIQALFLALYDAHAYLCTVTKTRVDPDRSAIAAQVVDAVHRRLVQDGRLLDGLHADGAPDTTTRPNLFLAYYVAPKLFSNDEWRAFFKAALPRLWLPWGGLSSIATDERGFRGWYTGEDVASYHRGDSWYFVNNIAAMALHSVDAQEFHGPVQQMLDASLHDLLSLGYAGHCSEVSSAAQQEACGCHAQAWSASTLLEALVRIDR